MKILLLLTPKPDAGPDEFKPLVVPEEKAVWPLYTAGVIREMYFQPEPTRVALVFEAANKDEVRTHIAAFPMVKAGLFDVDLIELGPWRQIEALFAR